MAFAARCQKNKNKIVDEPAYPHAHLITASNAGDFKNTPAVTSTALQLQPDLYSGLYQFSSNHVGLNQVVLPGGLGSSAAFQVTTLRFSWRLSAERLGRPEQARVAGWICMSVA